MAQVLLRNIRSGKRKAAIKDLNSLVREEIEKILDTRIKPALLKSHEIIVADWKHKPDFQSRKFITPKQIAVNVFPAGKHKKIWNYVNDGVPPHSMPAVSGKLMAFQGGGKYISKTLARPARTVSGGGKVTGGTKVVTMKRRAFTHPGSEARDFTKTIAEDIKPDFQKEMEAAFKKVANKVKE